MARKKITRSKIVKEEVQKPVQLTTTINCVVNSSYIVDRPDITNFTTTALLNGKPIDGDISNAAGKYKGIKVLQKNNKLIIYTGKHGLTSAEDATSGVLTIKFMEI